MVVGSSSRPNMANGRGRVTFSDAALKMAGSRILAADIEHQKRGQNSDEKQRAPGRLLREHLKDDGGEQRGRAPAQSPGALHRAHRLAAIGAANDLAHQHRARRPFASEAKTLEAAHHKQLPETLGEAGKKGEEREPGDHDGQHASSADAVGEHARDPASKG
jgi:hypothetical protein